MPSEGSAAKFEHGDFVRPRAGNVHIVKAPALTHRNGTFYAMACGKGWWQSVLNPADGDHGRQCQACWEAM